MDKKQRMRDYESPEVFVVPVQMASGLCVSAGDVTGNDFLNEGFIIDELPDIW